MERQIFISDNLKNTCTVAGKILKIISVAGKKDSAKTAFVLALEGNLGSGKTAFAQCLAELLKIKEHTTSPTFVIIKSYPLTNPKFDNFYHIDCYRIKDSGDLLDLGFNEIINNPKNLVVVEWAERIKDILPKENIIRIKFEYLEKDKRKIKILY